MRLAPVRRQVLLWMAAAGIGRGRRLGLAAFVAGFLLRVVRRVVDLEAAVGRAVRGQERAGTGVDGRVDLPRHGSACRRAAEVDGRVDRVVVAGGTRAPTFVQLVGIRQE